MPCSLIGLNDRIHWSQLLPLLGLSPRNQVLPAAVSCPECRGQLVIFPDYPGHGQWHWCRDCRINGSLLELAARVWKLSLPATLVKLKAHGIEIPAECLQAEQATRYQRQLIDVRQRFTTAWQKASDGLARPSREIAALMTKLGLRSSLNDKRHQRGPQQLMGWMTKQEAESVFMPQAAQLGGHTIEQRDGEKIVHHTTKPQNPSQGRVFRGIKWYDVLSIPFYDQPQRINGLLFIGRDGNPATDYVYRKQSTGQEDFGLAFHPEVLQPNSAWGNCVFALRDPLLAIKLQLRHFNTATEPAPVVLWHDGGETRSSHSWQMFAGRRVVFWTPTFDLATLRQAMLTGGYLSQVGPRVVNPVECNRWLVKNPATETLRLIAEHAVPWFQLLHETLIEWSDPQVEDLALQLQLHGEDLPLILSRLPASSANRIRSLLSNSPQQRSVISNRVKVVEAEGGWYATHRHEEPELISSAVLRIDNVVHYERSDHTCYQGRVLYGGEELPYFEEQSVVEQNTAGWLQKLLIRAGKGMLQHSPTWGSRLVSLASQFHTPRIIKGLDCVGWDERTASFVLPQYTVKDGAATPNRQPVFDQEALPAIDWTIPVPPAPNELARLCGDEAAPYWAGAGCLLTNVLAPAFGEETAGIVWSSPNRNAAEQLARQLGCRSAPVTRKLDVDSLLAAESAHRWPLYLSTTPGAAAWKPWLETDETHSGMLTLPTNMAAVLSLRGGWHAVTASIAPHEQWLLQASHVLGSYLVDLTGRKLDLPSARTWLDAVWSDFSQWAAQGGADEKTLSDARELILADGENPGGRFAELVAGEVLAGRVTTVPEGFESGPTELVRCKAGLFIGRPVLAKLIRQQQLPRLDPSRVTRILAQRGVLVGEQELSGNLGWLVDEAWWRSHLNFQRSGQGLLRLHG